MSRLSLCWNCFPRKNVYKPPCIRFRSTCISGPMHQERPLDKLCIVDDWIPIWEPQYAKMVMNDHMRMCYATPRCDPRHGERKWIMYIHNAKITLVHRTWSQGTRTERIVWPNRKSSAIMRIWGGTCPKFQRDAERIAPARKNWK